MSSRPATELLPPPAEGRTYSTTRRVRLGDVDRAGELRLDATARYLQDVASDDALDAELPNAMGWVVRRTLIRVTAPAVLNDDVELVTWCSGAGRSWAERRTSLRGEQGADIDAVSLWIQVDVATGRPARLGPEFDAIYGPAAGGRTVSSKFTLPDGGWPIDGTIATWRFRHTDVDPFGHVNNAAHWQVLEEVLAGATDRRGVAEIEYRQPADLRTDAFIFVERAAATTVWVLRPPEPVIVSRWTPA